MRWASAASDSGDLEEALAICADRVAAGLDGAPDLSVLFVSPHHAQREGYERAPALLAERMRPGLLVGCTAGGVIGGGEEIEERPGLSLTAARLPGVSLRGFHVDEEDLPPADAPPEAWRSLLGVPPERDPQFLLLADPFTSEADAVVRGLDRAYPGAPKVGGLASGGPTPGANRLYLGDAVFGSGTVGVAMTGDVVVETIVAQGCRPIGTPLFVTRCRGNVLAEVDDRPVLEALHAIYEGLDERDKELFRHSLFVGIVMDEGQEAYRQGDFLIRNILGVDRETGAIAVGALLHERQVVQFHLRDAETSADDLRALLTRHALETDRHRPRGALLFSCLGRGLHLYGRPNHDTDLFRERLGEIPLGGFFCNGEIGPVRGVTYIHGYTSSFGLFRPRGAAA